MTEMQTVPTIAETIKESLRMRGFREYAEQPVIDTIAQDLMARERRIYGQAYQSGQPATDEILRRLEENGETMQAAQPMQPGPADPADFQPGSTQHRLAQVEQQVTSLTEFARRNGYTE